MQLFLFLLLSAAVVYVSPDEVLRCYDKNDACHSSNYESYYGCVSKRYERSVDCDYPSCNSNNCINACDECDCDACTYQNCNSSCNSCCGSCCRNYVPCKTNHCCHKTCQAQCTSFNCRSLCRKNCQTIVKHAEDTDNGTNNTVNAVNDVRPNITTIIHLNNIINNTNIVDIPIHINNTNHQNISIENGASGGQSQPKENCCIVISPRQCVPHHESPFVRCFHYRSKQCGRFCTAGIMHTEKQQICEPQPQSFTPNCHERVIYIPQPQPRCSYQSVWPYVSCAIQQQPASCNGCYNHYVNGKSTSYLNCPYNCYDDGFGMGPYYRQGPFYRQTYTHAPCPTCFGDGGFNPYGGFAGFPTPGIGAQGMGYPPMGYGVPNMWYGGPGMGYAPPTPVQPYGSYGSWLPGVSDNFGSSFNGSYFNPLISVGPVQNPYAVPYGDPKEVEIEVKYEPSSPSSAQAAVMIKKESDDSVKETITENGKNDSSTNRSVTTASSVTLG